MQSFLIQDLKLSLNMGDQLEQPLPLTASANEVEGVQEQYCLSSIACVHCLSSIACVQSACWSRHFIIDPRFSNMPSGWATASTTSLLYISGYYTSKHGNYIQLYSLQGKILREHERERNLPITWMKAWTLKVPWEKLPHYIRLGVGHY